MYSPQQETDSQPVPTYFMPYLIQLFKIKSYAVGLKQTERVWLDGLHFISVFFSSDRSSRNANVCFLSVLLCLSSLSSSLSHHLLTLSPPALIHTLSSFIQYILFLFSKIIMVSRDQENTHIENLNGLWGNENL